ncbi:MAG: AAA family ATPase [Gammaproteobacteria bacterium]|nr:AAA family ATPase [Gammaproteobacteria bacterium]MDH5802778.1 AAA family ATPase [Gammaproteobacteria bacterium]
MSVDSIINTLLTALESNPDDWGMRLHVGDLLLKAERFEEAALQFDAVLARQPANLQALRGAAEAAEHTSNEEKAQGYRQLLVALGERTEFPFAPEEKHQSSSNVTSLHAAKPAGMPEQPHKLSVVENDDNVTVGPWEDLEPRITLDDVGGMEAVKKRLDMAFLAPLRNPEIMKMYGKSLQGGLLLYGPPGCGKTFIARALAGELGATFMSVGLSDVLDMYLGESERRLHEIFETARRKAPAVLFFDEVDALGQKRSNMRHSAGRTIVNQLLAEMDSVGSDNRNVFMLSATNHPWDVDTALRRPGRFDRMVLVLPPDREARQTILNYHLKDRPVEGLDITTIAANTEHYSGADLAHLVESAAEYAMHESISSGIARPINMDDFKQAVRDVLPSTRPWFETARNYAMFSNEGGVYDELLNYLQTHKL